MAVASLPAGVAEPPATRFPFLDSHSVSSVVYSPRVRTSRVDREIETTLLRHSSLKKGVVFL